mmetsp:Transcript_135295/g.337562  ORF Transcript_135295/g.337562 Transcript_135295/m.337562 type:complete len:192 (-) Transcript_135295:211-786(-)
MLCACCSAQQVEKNDQEDRGVGKDAQQEESVRLPSAVKEKQDEVATGKGGAAADKGKSTKKGGKTQKEAPNSAPTDLWVTFDAVDFKCRECSPALISEVGPVPTGSSVLDVLGGDELKRIVQPCINELCYSEDAPRSLHIKQVPMRPVKPKDGKTWTARVTLDFGELEEESMELDAVVVVAKIYDMKIAGA